MDHVTLARVHMGLEEKSCHNCLHRHHTHPGRGCMYYPHHARRDLATCAAVDECLGRRGPYALWAPHPNGDHRDQQGAKQWTE